MRTNIDIDDGLMSRALEAGPYKTKKEAVEAGLELLARRAAYREILKWQGQLKWEGDDKVDWQSAAQAEAAGVQEAPSAYRAKSRAESRVLAAAPTLPAKKAPRARR